MCTLKKFLAFLFYIGLIFGIIIGFTMPIWIVGWILFIGLLLCVFSHLIF